MTIEKGADWLPGRQTFDLAPPSGTPAPPGGLLGSGPDPVAELASKVTRIEIAAIQPDDVVLLYFPDDTTPLEAATWREIFIDWTALTNKVIAFTGDVRVEVKRPEEAPRATPTPPPNPGWEHKPRGQADRSSMPVACPPSALGG